jgi:two-component system alkaline phosphatase synthesis response regulator PhoP
MSEKKKILVVDDKEDIVETVSFCLGQEGFEVVTAFDGQQALEVARREQPDLIVLDVMLPKENGYQVARFLREDWQEKRLAKMPAILMLTARTVFDAQREEFLQTWSGADVFMYKPFDLDELTARVKSLLRVAANVDA